jgi:hypothetical protein
VLVKETTTTTMKLKLMAGYSTIPHENEQGKRKRERLMYGGLDEEAGEPHY